VKRLALVPLAAALLCGAAALPGCPNTTAASLYNPITGIEIDSSLLIQGLGCGTAPGQLYKYKAIVYEDGFDASQPAGSGLPVSGVFDCFSDAQFSNLPTPDGGNVNYVVQIYAYDAQSFPPELGACVNLPTEAAPPPCPAENPTNVTAYSTQATWTTTCSVTEIQGVSGVANCSPLVPTDAGMPVGDGGDATAPSSSSLVVETQAFVGADGGALRCGVDYDTVQASYTVETQKGTTPALPCPAPVTISPAVPDESYTIGATLVHADAAVGRATCLGSVAADASSAVAVCGPVATTGDF
jgi:hypothetical protein